MKPFFVHQSNAQLTRELAPVFIEPKFAVSSVAVVAVARANLARQAACSASCSSKISHIKLSIRRPRREFNISRVQDKITAFAHTTFVIGRHVTTVSPQIVTESWIQQKARVILYNRSQQLTERDSGGKKTRHWSYLTRAHCACALAAFSD
eukprot:5583848-Pleurochrysis_carterae.AAC.1